jgi:hypothetical protein
MVQIPVFVKETEAVSENSGKEYPQVIQYC